MSLTLTIPWEHLASSNDRNTRRGGKAHGWGYKQAREAIHLHALDQHRGDRPAFRDSVAVTIHFHPPDFRRRDCQNYVKVLLDAIQGVVYEDDYAVRDLSWLRKDPDGEEPRAEVTVRKKEAA